MHNMAVAVQQAGAAAATEPAPPVADPVTGAPVAVTAPTVTLDPTITDTSGTPTAQAATAGTSGTGTEAPAAFRSRHRYSPA